MIQTKSVKENTNIIFPSINYHLSIIVWSNRLIFLAGPDIRGGGVKKRHGGGKIKFQTTEPFWPIPLSYT
jgi:hypothetical protein